MMNKDEIKSSKQLNKKSSIITIASQIKNVREERRLQVLLLPLLLLLLMQMFNCNFNQQNRDCLLPYQNTSLKKTNVVATKGKENKQKSRNISLATDENKYIIIQTASYQANTGLW